MTASSSQKSISLGSSSLMGSVRSAVPTVASGPVRRELNLTTPVTDTENPEGHFVFVPQTPRVTRALGPDDEKKSRFPVPITSPDDRALSSIPLSVPMPRELGWRIAQARYGSMLKLVSSGKVDQTYRLRVTDVNSLGTSAGGVLGLNIVANPAALPFSEWSAFAALFDEVKLHTLKVHFWVYDPIAASTGPSIAVAGSFLSYATTVTSISQLANAGNSFLVPTVNTTQTPQTVSLQGEKLNWASTASPSPGPYAGCPGSCQVYGTGFTPSVTVGTFMCELVLYLRGRL